MARSFLIAAGGTGGHLYPGLAVADELKRRDPGVTVVFAGTPRGLESRIVPRSGHELVLLPILPLNAVGLARAARGLLALPLGLLRSAALVRARRPAAVLGIGGYAGGPVTLAAALLGVRTVILEPNARPGFTNRVLRPFVDAAACAYEATLPFYAKKGVLTGNPVRAAFFGIGRKPAGAGPLTLLAFGGSQGSRVLTRALVSALPHLPGVAQLRIVHQTGPAMLDEVTAAYRAAAREAEVVAYLDDMDRRFAEADLVLSRSGATTCAELCAAGRPAVLVPLAQAADDHQRVNALALREAGAALVVEEAALTGQSLAAAIRGLAADAPRRLAMGASARALARPDAAARVADLLEVGRA
jgi:UDP-N-acetylglucosamine--N-acetylmuramyl-(pentapeptide) pyrophosphoryl-undecaprenol N-acetylglucosamine transferase